MDNGFVFVESYALGIVAGGLEYALCLKSLSGFL